MSALGKRRILEIPDYDDDFTYEIDEMQGDGCAKLQPDGSL